MVVLSTCLLCVTAGLAMTFVVLAADLRRRENQLLAAYFLSAGFGAGAIFLSRILAFAGVASASIFYESYVACSLALLSLLALATHRAGLWQQRWLPVVLAALLVLTLAVQVPALHRDALMRFGGYGPAGELETRVTSLGLLLFAAMVAVGIAIVALAEWSERARPLVPGLLFAVAAILIQALTSTSRWLPVAVLFAAVSMILLAGRAVRGGISKALGADPGRDTELVRREAMITALRAFADRVAHDLKGPLGPLLGAAQILGEGGDELGADERRFYASMIDRNATAMARIIDSSLHAAKNGDGAKQGSPAVRGAQTQAAVGGHEEPREKLVSGGRS